MDNAYLDPYLPILILLGLAGVMCLAISLLAGYLGPKRIFPIKETAFECGSPTTGEPHTRHSVKFYLVALVHAIERGEERLGPHQLSALRTAFCAVR